MFAEVDKTHRLRTVALHGEILFLVFWIEIPAWDVYYVYNAVTLKIPES